MPLASLAAITYLNILKYALPFTVAKHIFLGFCELRNYVDLSSLDQESKSSINLMWNSDPNLNT